MGSAVSFKITRVINLVDGGVTEGGFREFWYSLGRSGGVEGVYLTPLGQVLPPWKSFRALNLVPNTLKWSNW